MRDTTVTPARLGRRILIDLPRWVLLMALVYAPWAYGSTPQWAISGLEGILAVSLTLWLVVAAVRGIRPQVHPVLLVCAGLILGFGWFMALNPQMRATANDIFQTVKPRFPGLPGSVDGHASITMMLRVTCLLGVICFACDLSSRPRWRAWVWRTMAATGVALILFGLVQSAFASPLLIWDETDSTVPYFATYYYHGNAGSFINLVFPLVAGLAILTLRRPDAHLDRAIWYPGIFICLAGAFVNVSRLAMTITLFLCALLMWKFYSEPRSELLPPRKMRWVYAALMVVAVAALVTFAGWQRPAEKWKMLGSQLNFANKRLVSTQVCLDMLPGAGWHGLGPGTFALAFPHYTRDQASFIPGIWKYAHDDYLQSLIEWGWAGSIPFAVVFFGAIFRLLGYWRGRKRAGLVDRVFAFITAIALVGVAANALIDFPLQIASLQLYACIYIGMGWGCGNWNEPLRRSKNGGGKSLSETQEIAADESAVY